MKDRFKIIMALVCICLLSLLSYGNALEENLNSEVVRLHILANSDSPRDQGLKLAVRDEVLGFGEDIFAGETIEEVRHSIQEKLLDIEVLCENKMSALGFAYEATAKLENIYFDTRDYDGFSLPAGYYNALRIELGAGDGKNWWCVVYPPLCVSSASKMTIEDVCIQYNLKEKNIDLITAKQSGSEEVVVKFKLVELCSKGKQLVQNLIS